MNPVLGFIEGFREIFSHKFRSLLTVSGVVLGVASLMAMFAVIEGMTAAMRRDFIRFGLAERVTIDRAEIPPEQQAMKDLSRGRTYEDVTALRKHAFLATVVSPSKRLNRVINAVHGNRRTQIFGLTGVDDEYLLMDNWNELGRGRFVTDLDLENQNRVIVLGSAHAGSLFPSGDFLGQKVRLDGVDFSVVGVLKKTGNGWLDNRTYIPLSTMLGTFCNTNVQAGVDQGPDVSLDEIQVRVGDYNKLNAALEQMRTLLDATHRGVQDYGLRTREDWFATIESQVMGARLSGGMVAVVCLLAGAVGITNIMLASIKERTREIGVRRAIGARPWDIFSQIVIEVFLLAVMGGVLGVAAGWGLVEFLEYMAGDVNIPIIRIDQVLISFVSGMAVGLGGGFIPAFRASQLEPIEALRYE